AAARPRGPRPCGIGNRDVLYCLKVQLTPWSNPHERSRIMTSFSIIGTGNMANAIGGVLSGGGSDVNFVSREQVGTAPLSDVVVLAVPYPAVAGILDAYAGQLDGKTIVDITNPLNFETF